MPAKPCIVCGTPGPGAYCAKHQPAESDHVTASRREKQRAHGRDTRAWRRLRGLALWKAGYECQLRLPGCTVAATSVHLDPDLQGDHEKATLGSLTACCAHCHGVVDGPRSVNARASEIQAVANVLNDELEVLIA